MFIVRNYLAYYRKDDLWKILRINRSQETLNLNKLKIKKSF